MKPQQLWLHGRNLIEIYRDREYFTHLFRIALPIATQNFIMSSLNIVGVIMIGQLGATPVAAVGLANQIFFLLNIMLFGITSGSAIFTAQLWGKRDLPNIRKVLSLSVLLGVSGSLIFLFIAELAPEAVLSIYSKDPAVISQGSQYLRLFGWSFVFVAITFSFAAVLRSTGDVKTPLYVSVSALGLNMVLSYALIFGHLGMPKLGVSGAALAGLVARIVECSALLFITYRRKSPVAVHPRELFLLDLPFIGKVLKPVLPVTLNEILWALGITTYNVVYARIGTDAIAAMNIAGTIDNLAFVIFIGIANACAILVGNQIGAGDEHKAFIYSVRSLGLAVTGAIGMGGLILLGSDLILSLYKVTPEVIFNAHNVMTIIALCLWLRVSNLLLYIGIFRSGGDTRFAFIVDGGVIWVVGVPMAFLGAFVFHLPVYWVYLMVMTEEITKWLVGIFRLFSKKWIHNLAHIVYNE